MKTLIAAVLSAVIAVSLAPGLSSAQDFRASRENQDVQAPRENQDVQAPRVSSDASRTPAVSQ